MMKEGEGGKSEKGRGVRRGRRGFL